MKTYNSVDLKGRLYNYALSTLSTDNGEAISGTVTLEVDAAGTTVEVRFFGRPTYSSGKPNKTYTVMDDMIAGNYKTVVDHGEDADWLGITASVDVSYFVSKNAQDDELARAQKMRGAFINPNSKKEYKNRWKVDMLITNKQEVEADEEKKMPRFVKVNGFIIDDYKNCALEVQFQARTEAAMNYILGLETSFDQPYYVPVWGEMQKVSRSIVRKNAFGEDEVDEYHTSQWVITGMAPEAYEWDTEATITVAQYKEVREALEDLKREEKEKAEKAANGAEELPF